MPTGVVVSEPSTPNPKEAAPAFLAGTPVSGAYAPVAALLHEWRRQAPDELGRFLARRVAGFGMREVSVYISDFEQRRLVPIAGSAEGSPIDMEGSIGGRCFTAARQLDEPAGAGVRLWSRSALLTGRETS